MPIVLFRVDERLIHGQVVVGWGQPLDIDYIVLVDDEVAASEWEQELYRMGVPPEMDVHFLSVEEAGRRTGRAHLHRVAGGHWVNADNPDAMVGLLVEGL